MGLVGVGQAEITGLQRQHVNVVNQQITFLRQKTRTPYTVPIYPQAQAFQKACGQVRPEAGRPRVSVNLAKSKNVEAEGKSKDAKKSLASLRLQTPGLPAYTQRSPRRMFITRCIEKGIDVKVIARWQGHQDGGKLILGTYRHVRNVHAEEVAKKPV